MSAHRPILVRILGKSAVPIVLLIGGHVALNGAAEPGGGLAGGALAAAGLMLYGLVFGIDAVRAAVPTAILRLGATLGFLALLAAAAAPMAAGYNFLDFEAFVPAGPSAARLGAAVMQAGLALITFCAASLVFYAVAGRVAEIRDEEW